MADLPPPPKRQKLHGRAFYNSLGAPKYILAPMVDQSEFAWRLLTRSFLPAELRGSLLAYTPMFHAKLFADSPKYRNSHFESTRQAKVEGQEGEGREEVYLDGRRDVDRPLFVQFCANDPDVLLAAAKEVQGHCDAVDLNLGCPQGIAKRGHYGAFLQETPELIHKMIRTLHEGLDVPVTAKMRILESREKTLKYAKTLLDAGASIITVHGRQRHMKGHYTGLADWSAIRYLREQLPPDTVIFANGNILQHADIQACLDATGVDAVMSAEGNLYDPSIFAPAPPEKLEEGLEREYWRGRDGREGYRADAVMRRYMDIIHKYVVGREPPARKLLWIPSDDAKAAPAAVNDGVPVTNGHKREAEDLEEPSAKRTKHDTAEPDAPSTNVLQQNGDAGPKLSKKAMKKQQAAQAKQNGTKQKQQHEKVTNPNLVAMQAHCFHMLRSLVAKHHNVRDALARCKAGDIDAYENVLTLAEAAVKEGLQEYEEDPLAFEETDGAAEVDEDGEESSTAAVRRCKRPYFICQPYVRPLPKEALEKGSVQLSKKQLREMEEAKAKSAIVRDERLEKSVGMTPGGKLEDVPRQAQKEAQTESVPERRVPAEGMVCG